MDPNTTPDADEPRADERARDDMERADRANGEPGATEARPAEADLTDAGAGSPSGSPHTEPAGHDTPTGTDPDARYERPGYEDKSLGQAVDQDRELVDRLLEETGGDQAAAEQRFDEESAGAPTLRRQRGQGAS